MVKQSIMAAGGSSYLLHGVQEMEEGREGETGREGEGGREGGKEREDVRERGGVEGERNRPVKDLSPVTLFS